MKPSPVGKIYWAMPEAGLKAGTLVAAGTAPPRPRPERGARGYVRLSVMPGGSLLIKRQSSLSETRARSAAPAGTNPARMAAKVVKHIGTDVERNDFVIFMV